MSEAIHRKRVLTGHRKNGKAVSYDGCATCCEAWPCEIQQLTDQLAAAIARAERAEALRAAVTEYFEAGREYVRVLDGPRSDGWMDAVSSASRRNEGALVAMREALEATATERLVGEGEGDA